MIVKKKTKRITLGNNAYILLIKSNYDEKCKHCELLKDNACLYKLIENKSLFSICSTMGSYIPKFLKFLGMTLRL